MDGKKVWAKVKEHRGEIFIATLTTVGVGAMAYFGIKKFSELISAFGTRKKSLSAFRLIAICCESSIEEIL